MDYQLKPMGKTCAQTGKEFRPGEICYSAVIEKGSDWIRLDYSLEGWHGPPEGAIGYWKCTAPASSEVKKRSLDPDALLRHFEQLCENANPADDKFRYVLGLLLVQRRRLRINKARTEEGASFLELGGLQGEGPFEVRDQQLNEQEIASLQEELNQRLVTEPA